jgi:hypothetical protein
VEEYSTVFLDGTISPFAEENGSGTDLPCPGDQARFLVPWRERESAQSEEEVLKDLNRRGVQRVQIFMTPS